MTDTVVWTKPKCPFCVKAKDLLTKSGIKFEERIVGGGWTREQLLESVPDAKTVPQIFLYGEHVGGYDQLLAYYESHDMWTNEQC